MLQHTLVTPTTLKCPELARWARLIACGGDMSPVGPLDDAAPSTAHTSLPCQKTPADLGIPGKFVGRTSLVARRGGARPPFFFYSGAAPPSADPLPRSPRRRPTSGHREKTRTATHLVKIANSWGFDSQAYRLTGSGIGMASLGRGEGRSHCSLCAFRLAS